MGYDGARVDNEDAIRDRQNDCSGSKAGFVGRAPGHQVLLHYSARAQKAEKLKIFAMKAVRKSGFRGSVRT
jgi:hypothetical protein